MKPYTTLKLSTKDQRLMKEMMQFWNRSDRGVLKLAFDQLVLATQQVQQRMQEKENEKGNHDSAVEPVSDSDDAASSTKTKCGNTAANQSPQD